LHFNVSTIQPFFSPISL